MTFRICVIEGDGIGKEVIPAAIKVLQGTSLPLAFEYAEGGYECFLKNGSALPEKTLELAKSCQAIFFGATSSPSGGVTGYRSPILDLRQKLELFANLRPQQSLPIPNSRLGVDLLLVRENTECLYVRRERQEGDTVIAERVISKKASERIMRVACEQALKRRNQVTVIHKANVLTLSDGLFRSCALKVAQEEYPQVKVEEMLVDTAALHLVQDPQRFDVMVTTNLFGDILSDAAAGLVGGLGLAPSANIGTDIGLFEPVHGSAPDIAGKQIANPIAAILAGALMLDFLKQNEAAQKIRNAVRQILQQECFSPDLGGNYHTDEIADAVLNKL